jgi:MoaD family protein
MDIEVRFYSVLREITDRRSETVTLQPNSSVRDLINILVEKYGDSFSSYIYDNNTGFRKHVFYMVNGVNINKREGFDTILHKDDVFSFLPPVGGG